MRDTKRALETRLTRWFDRVGIDRVVDSGRAVRLVEFAIAGIASTAANLISFLAAVGHVGYFVAGTAAFFFGITVAFNINLAITFDSPDGAYFRQYARYLVVSLAGYIVYIVTLVVAVRILSLPFLPADLLAIVSGGVINFVGSEEFAFPRASEADYRPDDDGGS